MANGYDVELTIDRKDNAKGYSPSNCRWATRQQQILNQRTTGKSQYRGVTNHQGKWLAQCGPAGSNRYIGTFDSEEDAARAYDVKASVVFGQDANLNFPEGAIKNAGSQ